MAPPSIKSVFAYAGNLLSQVPASLNIGANPSPAGLEPARTGAGSSGQCYVPLSGSPSCPLDGPLSCHNSTPVAGDSCCFVHPGGRMLLTQFWDDQVHVGGTEEAWTLHGLWPDLCTGGYDSYCNLVPRYNNISNILRAQGQGELVEFMDKYWIANRGSNEHLWEHEFNKHATCVNTLAPACYSSSGGSDGSSSTNPGELAVVDYFVRAVALFKTLDTFTALQRAGITPSSRTRYPLVDVQAALERHVGGGKVVLRCAGGRRGTILREAWYHFFVKGSLQTGEFVPAKDPSGHDPGNCAPWVRYLPKRTKAEL